jgi:hypothetical protein
MKGDSLGVVAGTGGDDALVALSLVQGEQLVESSALFEGTCALQILKLEMDGQAGQLRKMVRKLAGRDMDGVADAGSGGLDAAKTYGSQFDFSFVRIERGWQSIMKMKNHQPRLREVAWMMLGD